MKTSNDAINYRLRPAKHIERKMLVEALWRLQAFSHLKEYQYIGFGGRYFADFSLFHRQLGITRMVSIERDDNPRFEFNKPYEFVQIVFGESRAVLNSHDDWNRPMILWLDYDLPLQASQLMDVNEACGLMASGSALIVTVQSEPERKDSLAKLRKRVDGGKIPPAVRKDKDLANWKTARVYSAIVAKEVQIAMAARNAGRSAAEHFAFEPLFHFKYADGAKMVTYGGVVFAEADRRKFEACSFGDLQYVVRPTAADPDPEPYAIEVPFLTHREARHLDRGIPGNMSAFAADTGVPDTDVKRYERVYRYFPAFAESDL